MRKLLYILIAIIGLSACNKPDQITIDGTYDVTGKSGNGANYIATITLNGNTAIVNHQGFAFDGINLVRNGNTFTIQNNGKYEGGNGVADGNTITMTLNVYHSGHQVDPFTYSGVKQ